MLDIIFWCVLLFTFMFYMWDGGIDAIEERLWLRTARKEIKMMERGMSGNPGQGKESGRYED